MLHIPSRHSVDDRNLIAFRSGFEESIDRLRREVAMLDDLLFYRLDLIAQFHGSLVAFRDLLEEVSAKSEMLVVKHLRIYHIPNLFQRSAGFDMLYVIGSGMKFSAPIDHDTLSLNGRRLRSRARAFGFGRPFLLQFVRAARRLDPVCKIKP